MNDLIQRGLISPETELRWIIPGVIRHPSGMLLHAASGSGKSNVSFDLFRALTTGTNWLNFPASDPSKCLYIDGEQDDHDLAALQETYHFAECKDFHSNMHFLPLVSKPSINLLEDDTKDRLLKCIEDEGYRFVILDNSRSLFKGLDENSASSGDGMKDVSTFLQDIMNAGASVLLVHHDSKQGNYSGSTEIQRVLHYSLQIATEGAERLFSVGKVRGQGRTASRLRELDGAFYKQCEMTGSLHLISSHDPNQQFTNIAYQLEQGIMKGSITTSRQMKDVIINAGFGRSSSKMTMPNMIAAYFPYLKNQKIRNVPELKEALETEQSF